jgi:hypothetical protein
MSYAMLLRKPETTAPASPAKAPSTGLRIGEPNDSFEREADRVADEVMTSGQARPHWSLSSMSIGTPLQRKCACGGSGECEECQKNEATIQRRATSDAGPAAAPPIVYDVLRSPGRPLGPERSFFERRFGRDFGDVRIHTDGRAAESASSTNALAYAVGSNIVFAKGAYSPETREGQRLLAHELAHTLQQLGSGRAAGTIQRQAAPAAKATADFSGCDEPMQNDLREKHGPALEHVDGAIQALSKGWAKMDPADQAAFRQYFDPAGSGEIDEGFVRDVRANFQRVRNYMSSLSFDCDPTSKTICGSGKSLCTGSRIMWTCFGALHVCPDAYSKSGDAFKIENMIHESVHNALHTTDREYHRHKKEFSRLKPRGSGILSFLSNIPIIGALFRLIRANNDTLYNPDSYAGFAMRDAGE